MYDLHRPVAVQLHRDVGSYLRKVGMMTFDEAMQLLASCERDDLADFAFGDREISWFQDGKEIATGYSGSASKGVVIHNQHVFSNDDAVKLMKCGKLRKFYRNDMGEDR